MADGKLSRRDFLKAASTVIVSSAFAAQPSAPLRAQSDAIELNLWSSARDRAAWLESVIAEVWTDANPNVSIAVSLRPYADQWSDLLEAFAAGADIPDIVDIEMSALGQFVRRASREPFVALNDLIGEQTKELLTASATQPWTVRGDIYALGNEINPVLLYYRHDILDELGLDLNALETWDEFVSVLGEGAVAGGYGLFPIATQSWADFYVHFHQAGGEFFDAEGNVRLNSELAVEILSWQKAQLDSGVFIDLGRYFAQNGLISNGAFISIWGAPWFQSVMKRRAPELAGKWQMRTLPVWDENSFLTVPHGGTGMAITAASENQAASWEFLRACNLTVLGALLAQREMNAYPAYIPAWNSEELLGADDYFNGQTPGHFIVEAAAAMAPINVDPYWTLFVDAVNRVAVQQVMLDDVDPQTAIDEAIAEFRASR